MLERQKSEIVEKETLPEIGYIALDEDQPVACGFLRKVEGGYAQLDTFTTNPGFVGELRDRAINGIVSRLTEHAKSYQMHGLFVITDNQSIIDRAESIASLWTASRRR